MRTALRSIAAVVAGFVVASLVMMLIESINGHVLYPGLAKAAEGVRDRETMRALMANTPLGAFLVVLAGWALGGLAGGWVTAKLSPQGARSPALVLGVLLTLAGVANNLMLAPPVWFWTMSLAVLFSATHLGARLGSGAATSRS